MLRIFCEQALQYYVAAADSLLGVAINRTKYSFPVGKVDEINLFPMDFEEFLWAMNRENFAKIIREHFESNEPLDIHSVAIDLYNKYLTVGGMPAAVAEFVTSNSFVSYVFQKRTLGLKTE